MLLLKRERLASGDSREHRADHHAHASPPEKQTTLIRRAYYSDSMDEFSLSMFQGVGFQRSGEAMSLYREVGGPSHTLFAEWPELTEPRQTLAARAGRPRGGSKLIRRLTTACSGRRCAPQLMQNIRVRRHRVENGGPIAVYEFVLEQLSRPARRSSSAVIVIK